MWVFEAVGVMVTLKEAFYVLNHCFSSYHNLGRREWVWHEFHASFPWAF